MWVAIDMCNTDQHTYSIQVAWIIGEGIASRRTSEIGLLSTARKGTWSNTTILIKGQTINKGHETKYPLHLVTTTKHCSHNFGVSYMIYFLHWALLRPSLLRRDMAMCIVLGFIFYRSNIICSPRQLPWITLHYPEYPLFKF